MSEDLGARDRPVQVFLDYCDWCERPIDPNLEEFCIRRYLAAGGWTDIASHVRCFHAKLDQLILLGAVFAEDKEPDNGA